MTRDEKEDMVRANEITFDRTKRDLLRMQYKAAVSEHQDTFIFEGHPMLTSYVKYLLQFLDEKLK